MASALIHMAVAKRVNEKLKLNEKEFYLGSIAPDVAKIVGNPRKYTHFIELDDETDVPNINRFLSKYKKELDKPFELGYYVHLLTDVIWFDSFKKNFITDKYAIDKEGNKIKFDHDDITKLIYDDYTNVNSQILDYYDMDLSLFYEKFDMPESHIEEVPSVQFGALLTKMSNIILNSKRTPSYFFDIEEITIFIEFTAKYCLDKIKELHINL